MLAEVFTLVLQLPPLAFKGSPGPPGYQPPRELICPVAELGRPWQPPAPRLRVVRLPLDPTDLRPRAPDHVLNPVADIFLLFALAGLASSTGGSVDFRSWSERHTPALFLLPSGQPSWLPTQANPRF